jgi:hypothetical protein
VGVEVGLLEQPLRAKPSKIVEPEAMAAIEYFLALKRFMGQQ